MSKRLNFLVVGVQKSGTTTLDQYLRLHPAIGMPHNKKELHFFDQPDSYSKGIDYYHSFYSDSNNKKIWGECTPIYIYWQGVLERIYQYNPNLKLILVLRNPIERAFSHWNMEFTHNREELSFYDALISEKSRLSKTPNNQHRVYSYVDRGRYVSQIKNAWNIFGRKNLYILKFDDLVDSPESTLNDVYDFLGVPAVSLSKLFCSYQGDYKSKMMSLKEEEFLHECFDDEIKTLEKMLGWDCGLWLEN